VASKICADCFEASDWAWFLARWILGIGVFYFIGHVLRRLAYNPAIFRILATAIVLVCIFAAGFLWLESVPRLAILPAAFLIGFFMGERVPIRESIFGDPPS
jgi:hypothetical protein